MNRPPELPLSAPPIAAVLRTALLGLFLLGVLGTSTELLLLGHTEDRWQLVPLLLMAASLALTAWYGLTRSATAIRLFRLLMALFLGAGLAGILLHYRGNVEFELEMYPGMSGLELFREAMTGAFPALAPGAMILFGLVGLTWTYRHPALPIHATTSTRE